MSFIPVITTDQHSRNFLTLTLSIVMETAPTCREMIMTIHPDIPQPDPIVYDTPSDYGHSPSHEPMDESHPCEPGSGKVKPSEEPLNS